MQADLTFKDPRLEAAFIEHHAGQQRHLEVNFHFARALAWAAVGIRAANARQYQNAIITILGAITTVLPSFAHKAPKALYLRWRPAILIADNLLQVGLGCYTHDAIYPGGAVTAWRSVFVLLSGNGVAWLLFSGLWGCLTFKHSFPQQAALTIILLLYNRTLCGRSAALVHAYTSMKVYAMKLLRLAVRPSTLQAGLDTLRILLNETLGGSGRRDSVGGAVGSPFGGTNYGVGGKAEWDTAACASATGGGMAQQQLISNEMLCLLMQPITLLILGFLLPTFYIYASELQQRLRFARSAATAYGVRQESEGGGLGASHDLFHWLDRQHALGPNWIDYFMFGLPAVACMYIYVVSVS